MSRVPEFLRTFGFPMFSATVLLSLSLAMSGCVTTGGGQPSFVRPVQSCSGCGGTGHGSAYLSRQGYSQVPGFRNATCPRCNGTGRSGW